MHSRAINSHADVLVPGPKPKEDDPALLAVISTLGLVATNAHSGPTQTLALLGLVGLGLVLMLVRR